MKAKAKKIGDELRPEYNFDYSKAVRGKYYKRILDEGATFVVACGQAFVWYNTNNTFRQNILRFCR
ncbi:MAG TPA: hypothetical protein ACFYEB_00615 [Candidatus Brocadiia bacterium]|nr:hypothetical protein [Candidatus Brocadiales bacterium]